MDPFAQRIEALTNPDDTEGATSDYSDGRICATEFGYVLPGIFLFYYCRYIYIYLKAACCLYFLQVMKDICSKIDSFIFILDIFSLFKLLLSSIFIRNKNNVMKNL